MNLLYKSLFLDKISIFPCYISYRNSKYTFEKPFRCADDRNKETLMKAVNIKLFDCTSSSVVVMNFGDIDMFYIRHECDMKKCEKELEKTITENQKIFFKFRFLKGPQMHDLFFRTDLEETKEIRLRNMLLLDLSHLDSLNDYDRLVSNDKSVIQDFRNGWHKFILDKYNEIIGSLVEESKNIKDESIVSELESIKEIIGCIPKEAENELLTKNTIEEIMDYWPTLLLPKVEFKLDAFDEPPPNWKFKLKAVNVP